MQRSITTTYKHMNFGLLLVKANINYYHYNHENNVQQQKGLAEGANNAKLNESHRYSHYNKKANKKYIALWKEQL